MLLGFGFSVFVFWVTAQRSRGWDSGFGAWILGRFRDLELRLEVCYLRPHACGFYFAFLVMVFALCLAI